MMKQNISPFIRSQKNERDIDDVLESIYNTIISNIQKPLGKRLGWIIGAKYKPFSSSIYIKT